MRSGYGKPYEVQYENPYLSDLDNKVNRILANNNFSSEWIILQNEVKADIKVAREDLTHQRDNLLTSDQPANVDKPSFVWKIALDRFASRIEAINRKIDEINLKVPALYLQQVHYSNERELRKLQAQWKRNG